MCPISRYRAVFARCQLHRDPFPVHRRKPPLTFSGMRWYCLPVRYPGRPAADRIPEMTQTAPYFQRTSVKTTFLSETRNGFVTGTQPMPHEKRRPRTDRFQASARCGGVDDGLLSARAGLTPRRPQIYNCLKEKMEVLHENFSALPQMRKQP